MLSTAIDFFSNHPRKLFLADAIGAILSALLLILILANFETFFGLPKHILYKLAILPILFSIYSFGCYLLNPARWQFFLRNIAIANILYCGITLVLVVAFYHGLSSYGIAYFLLEVPVILFLSIIELRVAGNQQQEPPL
jgi:hypothetical protein